MSFAFSNASLVDVHKNDCLKPKAGKTVVSVRQDLLPRLDRFPFFHPVVSKAEVPNRQSRGGRVMEEDIKTRSRLLAELDELRTRNLELENALRQRPSNPTDNAATVRQEPGSTQYLLHLEQIVNKRTRELAASNRKLDRAIADRKRIENRTRAGNTLLKLLTEAGSLQEYLDRAVLLLRTWSGCRCAGISLFDDARPCASYVGFKKKSPESENPFLLDHDQPVYPRDMADRDNSQDFPYLTRQGSFLCSDAVGITASDDDRPSTRFIGKCIRSGFASVAVIPIRQAERVAGAILLADRRPWRVAAYAVELIESNTHFIADAIHRFQTRDELRFKYDTQEVIGSILGLSLRDIPLEEFLAQSLNKVLFSPSLGFQPQGAIFVVGEDRETLVMKARIGIPDRVATNCAQVPFGKCLCGQAAVDGAFRFFECLKGKNGSPHETVRPHGHYCVPILFSGQTLGVMNLTLKAGHKHDRREEEFLLAVANVIAGILQRKQVEKELQIHTQRLEQSNRNLQDFAFVASHDLQEPLRKIQTFGERLRSKCADVMSDTAISYLERMQNAAARMQRLIDALLTFSRVTVSSGRHEMTDLRDVIGSVLSDLELLIEQAGGRVEVGSLPVVMADADQMRQLFQNLIGNALKFQAEGSPRIGIRSHWFAEGASDEPADSPGWYRIFVEDNGIGFDEASLERIFAPFQRLHGREAFEGTGMGLAICKKIVESHGGEITARSSPGNGATFIVTLPAGKTARAGCVQDGSIGPEGM